LGVRRLADRACGIVHEVSLAEAWERHAAERVAWTRQPGHDSFTPFHRDQFLELVPPPGRLTLDLGCGEGRLSRVLKSAGHTVAGVAASPTLVAAAREADPSIPFHVADAAALPVAEEQVDLVVAFMCLHDFDALDGTVREIARVLAGNGHLCLAVVHPLHSAGCFSSREPGSPFLIAGSYLHTHRYSDTAQRDGLTMTFHSCHRPLECYANTLQTNGLMIEAMREPSVPDAGVSEPHDLRWRRVPLFLHIRALKLAA
jgi:SAM-dependent methyltransferase